MPEPMTTLFDTPVTKLEFALFLEAQRRLLFWWPYDDSTFWVPRVALFAVVGDRALPGVGSDATHHRRVLDHFNESACLDKSAIIPHGWVLVPCPPTEQMLKACVATWPGPRTGHAGSVIKKLRAWFAKRRHRDHEGPSTETNARLQWLEGHRATFMTNYLAMVAEAPPPPWVRR